MATVLERITKIVVDKLSVEDEGELKENSSFVEDLKADSLDLVELIMAIEEEFKDDVSPESDGGQEEFHFPDEESAEIRTIAQAVCYLKEHGVQDV